jgi:DNA polymerase-3 subunit delta'
MQIDKYLKENQQVVYKTFINALENKKLSHAYLIVGNKGTPLKEVATYLAKSILCDSPNPLACDNCITCMRIDNGNYADFVMFDGESKTIGKGNVSTVEDKFEKSAFEEKGIRVYVLNCIEYMTEEASNSILKFLEEPKGNVHAILTTNNENGVLPTITSRCQLLRLKSLNRAAVIEEAISLGAEKDDAQLLSYFYNNGELINDIIKDKERSSNYKKCKEATLLLLDALTNDDKRYPLYVAQAKVLPLVNKKEIFRFFLDVLITVFEDLINIKNSREIYLTYYDKILRDLSMNKLNHLDETLLELLKQRNLIKMNLNIGLQLDHIIYQIIKE